MKWSWAEHINHLKVELWTSRVTLWRPYGKKRRQRRPAKEIQRRIMADWAAYAKHWELFKSNLAIWVRESTKVMDEISNVRKMKLSVLYLNKSPILNARTVVLHVITINFKTIQSKNCNNKCEPLYTCLAQPV